MAFHSGNGSTITVGSTVLHCKRATLRKNARLVENTHSGVSSSNYERVVPDHSWTVEVPWDDTNLPDTDVGLVEGAKATIVFAKGGSGKTMTLTNTTVETLEDVMDNEGDIIRTVITGKGGALTRETT